MICPKCVSSTTKFSTRCVSSPMVSLIVSLFASRGSKSPRIGNSEVKVQLPSSSNLVWVCDANLFQEQVSERCYTTYIQDKDFRSSESSKPVLDQRCNDLGMRHRAYHYCKCLNTCQRCPEQKSLRMQRECIFEVRPCNTISLIEGSTFQEMDPASGRVYGVTQRVPRYI